MKFFKKDETMPKDIEGVDDYLKKLAKKVEDLTLELEKLKEQNKKNLQRVEMKRYNPFPGVGGDQSFTIAMLDGNNDGVVMTSLFSQEGNRVYAKPIKKSGSEYLLSDEEKNTIEKAAKN